MTSCKEEGKRPCLVFEGRARASPFADSLRQASFPPWCKGTWGCIEWCLQTRACSNLQKLADMLQSGHNRAKRLLCTWTKFWRTHGKFRARNGPLQATTTLVMQEQLQVSRAAGSGQGMLTGGRLSGILLRVLYSRDVGSLRARRIGLCCGL